MDTKSISTGTLVEAGQPSRLPAGSTMIVGNGIHVPHPHAEVNLAGAGDPRLGETDAVTESVQYTKSEDGVVTGEVTSDPLHDSVRPRRLTTSTKVKELSSIDGSFASGAAAAAKLDLKEDPENKVVEVKE